MVALVVAASYPFSKRFFPLPQAWLGIAFGMSILMAFAAYRNNLPPIAWMLFVANIFWAIAYDTEYAMVDRDDDMRLNVKSSALLFGVFDVVDNVINGEHVSSGSAGLMLGTTALYLVGYSVVSHLLFVEKEL